MTIEQEIWRVWAEKLQNWGMAEWAAIFLESAGPLAFLGSQAIYITQPAIGTFISNTYINAAAHLLEEPSERDGFIELLREEGF
ncbi:MAG: hypothetical protein U9R58_13535 [Chloroflexota bacterium]|nr:hypothetical protein [Chloroflexota bacterium]